MTGAVVCPRCSTVNPVAARFCSNCGLERQDVPTVPGQPFPPTAPAVAAPTKPPIPRALKVVGYVIVAVVAFAFVSGALGRPRGGGGGGSTTTTTWSPPAGFTAWSGDRTIAYRWEDDGECIMGGCWHMTVITKDGCPNALYVELSTLSGSTVVGFTNDSVGSVRGGERARLSFENTDNASKARLSEITCY